MMTYKYDGRVQTRVECVLIGWVTSNEQEGDPTVNADARMRCSRKPRACPNCGHAPVAKIVYGLVMPNEEMFDQMAEGSIALGGCVIFDDGPVWKCFKCGLLIYRTRE